MSAGGIRVRSSHSISRLDDPTLRTGNHISPGSSVTAVDTNSSVRLLLDSPCLFQLTHLLMNFSDSLRNNYHSSVIIPMASSSVFVN